jgi:hypothetical protein
VSALIAIDSLIADRRLWRGKASIVAGASGPLLGAEPTGFAALDAALPTQGWPESALIELLHAFDGMGELRVLLPTLARHTQAGRQIALIAPPYLPNPRAWLSAGVDLQQLRVIDADQKSALWATEQCLRSACLAAVLCWPQQVDDKALRRLQVAAETGRTLAFALRDQKAAHNPSPAPLRVQIEKDQLRILKCRGANAPAHAIAFPHLWQ